MQQQATQDIRRADLKRNFEKACNNYLQEFIESNGLEDEGNWIGGEAGGIIEIADYIIDMITIRTAVDNNITFETFDEWYAYCETLGMLGAEDLPSLKQWINGCPRRSPKEIKALEEAHARADAAKEEFDRALQLLNRQNAESIKSVQPSGEPSK